MQLKNIKMKAKEVRDFFNLHVSRTLMQVALAVPGLGEIYCAIATPFRSEIRASLHGCVRYLMSIDSAHDGSALLRRNVHRLEKGMIMRPRRSLFADGYIQQTVECFANLVKSLPSEPSPIIEELLWARGVLYEYFNIVDHHPKVDKAYKLFNSIQLPPTISIKDTLKRIPSFYKPLENSPVFYSDFKNLLLNRHSIRWFQKKCVDRNTIDSAIDIARHTPSACNRQPFTFRIIDDPTLVRKVSKIPNGTGGYADNIPCMVFIVGRLSAFGLIRSRHTLYVDGALASMTFVLALETLGVQSCLIVWPDKPKKDQYISKLLSLNADERIVVCCAIGYADPEGKVACSTKKPVELLRRYNLD